MGRAIAIGVGWLGIALGLTGCHGGFPRDPSDTLTRVRNAVLRVGVSERVPLVRRQGKDWTGPEIDLVKGFARDIGARIEYVPGSEAELIERLHRGDLQIVAAGLEKDTPWKDRVALTRPYDRRHVLATPLGENAFLAALERHILSSQAGARGGGG